ncbi:MAG: hypothetical protein ACLR8Y_21325 [Alistipes indistinctus]
MAAEPAPKVSRLLEADVMRKPVKIADSSALSHGGTCRNSTHNGAVITCDSAMIRSNATG